MEAVRLRLLFEDRYILSKSQRKDGLRRSWILLKPQQHQTISDLSSYILHFFRLHHSCPHGLILSMDDFVLPPFESTCVLNDKDIISVKKKGGTLTKVIEVGDGVNFLKGEEVLERQPVVPGVKLLSNEEFDKETGGHDSEQLGDAVVVKTTPVRSTVSKKRKASEKLPSSKKKKKKKSKFANAETSPAALEVAEIDVCQDRNSSPHRNVLLKKKGAQEDNSDDIPRETENSCSSNESDPEKRSGEISKSLPDSKRFCQIQEKGKGNVDVSQTPGGAKKFPSRSARRKKAKRQWLREQSRLEKELQQKQLLEKDNQRLPSKENFKVSEEHQQPVQNGEHDAEGDTDSDAEDNVVPIVVRPGHIRFEPLDKDEDQSVWQNQFSVGTFQWNGINSKKKGQKWGKEKIVSSKRNNYKNFSQACSEEVTVEEEMPVNNQMEFDKLVPYSSLPKEGDMVAYRLIELSSSWTPELSSCQVGKISHYDSVSNRIKLAPVVEYPITNKENTDEEASGLQPDTSLYAEDGSLEIDYSSLVDVRLVKLGNSNSAKSVTGGANENCVYVQDAVTSTRPDDSMVSVPVPAASTPAPPKENGPTNAWEEIAQAFNAKKAELSKEDEWSNTKSSGKSPWSYRALRGSALGPTMAILRAQNEI
ncbi:hypothetical protein SLA2020_463920 [Shorea laevis]